MNARRLGLTMYAPAGLLVLAMGAIGSHQCFADSQVVGPADPTETVSFALTLPLQNQSALQETLDHIYTPGDPLFHHYLSSTEFDAQFAPTAAQYTALEAWAAGHGLSIDAEHAGRTVLDVSGTAVAVGSLFQTGFVHKVTSDGVEFHAPSLGAAVVPSELAAIGVQAVGLDNGPAARPASIRTDTLGALAVMNPEPCLGSGPLGTYAPSDIRTAYQVNSLSQTGTGQKIGLVEFATADYGDSVAYASYFGLPAPNLNVVNVDSGTTSYAGGDEVILDIDMVELMAPNMAAIDIYTAPNTQQAEIDTFTAIADANAESTISSSWGTFEPVMINDYPGAMASEETQFEKMAAQGQSMFASAGDTGAYDYANQDGPPILAVSDPSSDPYVTGVGGTRLTTGSGQVWTAETTWNDEYFNLEYAGGGGISQFWSIPSYQSSVSFLGASGQYSTTMRNVPDVSLNADLYPGYGIYLDANDSGTTTGWFQIGGTSASSPLWAAFTSLVNQETAAESKAPIGFLNPALYPLAESQSPSTPLLHDIADDSNNHAYYAVEGYDDATGWGTLIAPSMLNALTGLSTKLPASTTTVKSSANPSGFGSSVTFTATVAGNSPTGSVQFAVDAVDTGSPVALTSGSASFATSSLAVAGHTISAVYSGDANNATSSGKLTQTVNALVPTITAITPPSTNSNSAIWVTITGTNFVPSNVNYAGSAAYWNGVEQTSEVNSTTEMSVYVTANESTSGVPVTVVNPGPGGGTSNAVTFKLVSGACIQVPAAPSSASASGTTSSGTTLKWSKVTAPSGCTTSGYTIYNGGGVTGTTTSTTFKVTGLTDGTTYSFAVAAVDAGGTGAQSSPVEVITTNTCAAKPATPSSLAASGTYSTGTMLSWNAVTAPTDCVLSNYEVYENGSALASSSVPYYSVTGLVTGSTYTFAVAAVDSSGTGTKSATVKVVTPTSCSTLPSTPAQPSASNITSSSATISWSAVTGPSGCPIAGYELYENGVAIEFTSGTSFTVTGLTADTNYTFTVAAVDAAGTGAASPGVQVTTQ